MKVQVHSMYKNGVLAEDGNANVTGEILFFYDPRPPSSLPQYRAVLYKDLFNNVLPDLGHAFLVAMTPGSFILRGLEMIGHRYTLQEWRCRWLPDDTNEREST